MLFVQEASVQLSLELVSKKSLCDLREGSIPVSGVSSEMDEVAGLS